MYAARLGDDSRDGDPTVGMIIMTRVMWGAVSFNTSSHLPSIGPSKPAKPVMLPPG
jgi:hypothetical protein